MERPWPAAVAGSPAVAVIQRAIDRERLSHSLLLHGEDPGTLEGVAYAIADRLLAGPSGTPFPAERHPDCFLVRPAGKSRTITADIVRDLIGKVQVSPALAPRKVAIIHEADRMNASAANIFLKTLEEPPARTALLLLSTRPHALIPTIRSRVLHFRFPGIFSPFAAQGWSEWLGEYQSWLARIFQGVSDRRAVSNEIFSVYGLLARFSMILERETTEAWDKQKPLLPGELDEAEQVAIETGISIGIRARLFGEIERSTRAFAVPLLDQGDGAARRSMTGAIDRLEQVTRLLRLNLNEMAALEDFLLASLRLWTRK